MTERWNVTERLNVETERCCEAELPMETMVARSESDDLVLLDPARRELAESEESTDPRHDFCWRGEEDQTNCEVGAAPILVWSHPAP